MYQLNPHVAHKLAAYICGDAPGGPFEYRRAREISEFFTHISVEPMPELDTASRARMAESYLQHACRDRSEGSSGLPAALQTLLESLVRRVYFPDDVSHTQAIDLINSLLIDTRTALRKQGDGSVQLVNTSRTRQQRVLDKQVHSPLALALESDKHETAKYHYNKCRELIYGPNPDYENAVKEAVSSIESLATALTAASDLPAALKLMVGEGRLPRPLDQMILRFYDFRGNEPGVGHGRASIPTVSRDTAELAFNLAGVINLYVSRRFAREPSGNDSSTGGPERPGDAT